MTPNSENGGGRGRSAERPNSEGCKRRQKPDDSYCIYQEPLKPYHNLVSYYNQHEVYFFAFCSQLGVRALSVISLGWGSS